MEDHIHQWKPYLPDAEGSARGSDKKRGKVLSCNDQPCGVFLFIPHTQPEVAIESVMVEDRREAVA